jgi:MSHA biogenesis protein MshL
MSTCALALLITGCTVMPPEPTVAAPDVRTDLSLALENNAVGVQNEKVQVPADLTNALLSLDQDDSVAAAPRFDVQADNIDAQQFFKDLVQGTGLNMVVDPEITGGISMRLANVTVSEVLNAVRDVYGYDYQKTSYGYRIISNRITTRIFNLDYLNVNRSGSSGTGITGSQIASDGSQSSQVTTTYTADFWADLEQTLQTIIGDEPDTSVVINAQTGVVVVRANPVGLQSVEQFLMQAENMLQKQVIIEARIIEVTLSDGFKSGIDWNTFASDLSRLATDPLSIALNAQPITGNPDLGGIFNIGANVGDFSALIQLLSNQGEVKVLSSPRISTVNNQKAVIKVGTDEYYVTNVRNTANADGSAGTPDLTLTPFFSGIALDVTPQIGQNNEIILHVRPSVTEVTEKTKSLSINGSTYALPLATSSIREADSIIKATNGQIVIIGGLLQNKGNNQTTGIPGLASLPGFKWLFGQQQRMNEKSELIILLQPQITNNMVWQQEISAARDRMGQ